MLIILDLFIKVFMPSTAIKYVCLKGGGGGEG